MYFGGQINVVDEPSLHLSVVVFQFDGGHAKCKRDAACSPTTMTLYTLSLFHGAANSVSAFIFFTHPLSWQQVFSVHARPLAAPPRKSKEHLGAPRPNGAVIKSDGASYVPPVIRSSAPRPRRFRAGNEVFLGLQPPRQTDPKFLITVR